MDAPQNMNKETVVHLPHLPVTPATQGQTEVTFVRKKGNQQNLQDILWFHNLYKLDLYNHMC